MNEFQWKEHVEHSSTDASAEGKAVTDDASAQETCQAPASYRQSGQAGPTRRRRTRRSSQERHEPGAGDRQHPRRRDRTRLPELKHEFQGDRQPDPDQGARQVRAS